MTKRYARLAVVAVATAAALGMATPAQAHWCNDPNADYPITACLACAHLVDHLRVETLVDGVDCTPFD